MSFPHFNDGCDRYHDLVVDFGGDKPIITVLCGSTRFHREFQEQNLNLTLAGHIVLTVGCDTQRDEDLMADGVFGPVLKQRLDDLHKRKIDLADEVLVLNIGGYIGDSTRSEIDYAEKLGKPVRYLEVFDDHQD